MKAMWRRGLALGLALALCGGLTAHAAVDDKTLDDTVAATAEYVYQTVKTPQVGSIGGEWAVLGLARSGYDVPERYYQDYYAGVEAYVTACEGKLHDKKYTEYSRVIVALAALGVDARDVAGFDLTAALGDYDKTIWQGLNGPVWALIALDSMDYPMPRNPQAQTQATRQMYIDRILDCQLSDGGWSLTGGTRVDGSKDGPSDPDITGMALQALAKYQDQPAVAKATGEALACMSGQQDADGGYSSFGVKNSESCVQMIVGLCELGVPVDDPRFVKNGRTLVDNLMDFHTEGKGFTHTIPASGSDQMATEQALYALAAVQRQRDGRSSLYRMDDAKAVAVGTSTGPKRGQGLAGKAADVKAMPLANPGATFDDVSGHRNQPAVEALAARNIIAGKDGGNFDPDGAMTRAEFAAIVVKALGLAPQADGRFSDVPSNAWYAGFVGAASSHGIVNGSGGKFDPDGAITRQEAAVMVANAAKLCGMDTAVAQGEDTFVLGAFLDSRSTAAWARPSLTFCYRAELLDPDDMDIRPTEAAKRCEIAQMLFDLLGSANLL